MHTKNSLPALSILRLGTKILFAVAVTTTLCIGSLVYMNLRSSRIMEETVNEILATREELSANLRESIVDLQNSFLALPDFFRRGRR